MSKDDFDFEWAEMMLGRIRGGAFDDIPVEKRLHLFSKMGMAVHESDRLQLYQQISDRRLWPPHVGFHAVARVILNSIDYFGRTHPPELEELGRKIEQIERAHGLAADEFWRRGEGPADWQELNDQWARQHEEFQAQLMREHGEKEMADLFLNDRAEFDRRFEAGRLAVLRRRPRDEDESS